MADNIRSFPSQKTGGDRRANRTIFRRTMFLMVFFGVLIFVPLLWKLWTIQITDHDWYEQKAIEQQTGDKAVAADRGTIYDSKGSPLAMSAEAYYIQLSPREIIQCQKKYAEKVEKALAETDPEKREKLMPGYDEPTNESIARNLNAILGVEEEEILKSQGSLPADELLIQAKKDGFSDKYLSQLLGVPEKDIRQQRYALGCRERWFSVPVSGVEDEAYYYSTYNASDSSSSSDSSTTNETANATGQGR